MVTVHLSTFSKKTNSTKQPATLGTTVRGIIKESCSILNPVVEINLPQDSNLASWYNYAYIPEYRRYYFINDWVWSGALWEAHMAVDVLASYKEKLLSVEEFVLRSASMYDEYITDSSTPPTGKVSCVFHANQHPSGYGWTGQLNRGSFVVGVISSDKAESSGTVTYYVLTSAQMGALRTFLLGDSAYLDVSENELSNSLVKTLFNPWQYVVSCLWFPFDVHKSVVSPEDMTFGWWQVGGITPGVIAGKGYSLHELRFIIPKHPQTESNGKYMNRAPFTTYELFVPGFGATTIPAAMLVDAENLFCQIVTDSITGIATMAIFEEDSDGPEICRLSGQIGVPYQIAGRSGGTANFQGITLGGVLGNALMMYDNMLEGVFGKTGLIGMNRGIGAALADIGTNVSTSAPTGNISQFYYPPYLKACFTEQPTPPHAEIGRPLCQMVTLGDLSGFVQCAEGETDIAVTQPEKAKLREFLEGGFYIE